MTVTDFQHAIEVHGAAIDVLTNELNALVEACTDVNGTLKTPDRKAFIRARSMLPPRCAMTLTKKP